MELKSAMDKDRVLIKSISEKRFNIKNMQNALDSQSKTDDDLIANKLIELNSLKNNLKSLNTRKMLEQIKQNGAHSESQDESTFQKIKCMFSKSNAVMIQLDKFIAKAKEQHDKLDADIEVIKSARAKNEINLKSEIHDCDKLVEENNMLEHFLISASGLTKEKLLVYATTDVSKLDDIGSSASASSSSSTEERLRQTMQPREQPREKPISVKTETQQQSETDSNKILQISNV
jgi:hypothetical protein